MLEELFSSMEVLLLLFIVLLFDWFPGLLVFCVPLPPALSGKLGLESMLSS